VSLAKRPWVGVLFSSSPPLGGSFTYHHHQSLPWSFNNQSTTHTNNTHTHTHTHSHPPKRHTRTTSTNPTSSMVRTSPVPPSLCLPPSLPPFLPSPPSPQCAHTHTHTHHTPHRISKAKSSQSTFTTTSSSSVVRLCVCVCVCMYLYMHVYVSASPASYINHQPTHPPPSFLTLSLTSFYTHTHIQAPPDGSTVTSSSRFFPHFTHGQRGWRFPSLYVLLIGHFITGKAK
jgi:hypothetical protein